jgi:hypothetical protein
MRAVHALGSRMSFLEKNEGSSKGAFSAKLLMRPNAFEIFLRREARLSQDSGAPGALTLLRIDLLRLLERWANPAHASPPSPVDASRLASGLGADGFATLAARWGADAPQLWAALQRSVVDGRLNAVEVLLNHPGLDMPSARARDAAKLIGDFLAFEATLDFCRSEERQSLKKADAALARLFDQARVSPKSAQSEGVDLLRLATLAGSLSWTNRLLAAGADANTPGPDGLSPTALAFGKLQSTSGQKIALALVRAGGADERLREMALDSGNLELLAALPAGQKNWWTSSSSQRAPLTRLMKALGRRGAKEDEAMAPGVAALAASIARGSEPGKVAMELSRASGIAQACGLERCAQELSEQGFAALEALVLETASLPAASSAEKSARL